ncbi:hypothetical protein ACFXG4_07765 [Nocardia sp. NPDC059246]|uniref:hypothetical protein n=1 Tax=unclassified Nocardia TaxID=2637762 RepID=UPI0036CF889E
MSINTEADAIALEFIPLAQIDAEILRTSSDSALLPSRVTDHSITGMSAHCRGRTA